MGWDYVSIPKLQQWGCWSLAMDKWFCYVFIYLSIREYRLLVVFFQRYQCLWCIHDKCDLRAMVTYHLWTSSLHLLKLPHFNHSCLYPRLIQLATDWKWLKSRYILDGVPGETPTANVWLRSVSVIVCSYSISQEICTRFCCALLCCGYAIVHNELTWSINPYSSGLLCWHWGNR